MSDQHVSHTRHVVLVVDDDPQVLMTLRDILSRDGFDVLTAQDATHALELLDMSLPCMILLDVEMPGINGFELCRRIKRIPRTAHVPVTLISAWVQEAHVLEGIAAGAVDYIKKPFDKDEVRMRVRMQIRLHEALMEQERANKTLAFISSAAQDAIIIIDTQGKISHWNEAAERIFGYTRDEALWQDLHVLLAPRRFHAAMHDAFPRFQDSGNGAAVGRTLELTALRKSGEEFPIELSLASARIDDQWCAVGIIRDITEREQAEKALQESTRLVESVVENVPLMIFLKEAEELRFVVFNRAGEELLGYDRKQLLGKNNLDLFPPEQAAFFQAKDRDVLARGVLLDIPEEPIQTANKGQRLLHTKKVCIKGSDGVTKYLLGISEDITEQKRLEVELAHARKLEAVGQLAAGIAHEINTPIQYVCDSLHFLKEAFEGHRQLAIEYKLALQALEEVGGYEAHVSQIHEAENAVDLAYLEANVPGSFDRCLDGISRISTIVRAMKEFAHPDQREKSLADLNQALQNTLIIAKNEYKYVSDVELELGELPPVRCHVGDLNQVFLNLIVNAAHAIGDVVGQGGNKGQIRIRSLREGGLVRFDIADTGTGIPESIRHRVFEPFFTTKEVGKGTGQGLAIAHSIIVERHGGSLTFESEVGKGTTFTIRLPTDGNGTD